MSHINMDGSFTTPDIRSKIEKQIYNSAPVFSTEYYVSLDEFYGKNIDKTSIPQKAVEYMNTRKKLEPQILVTCSSTNLSLLKNSFFD